MTARGNGGRVDYKKAPDWPREVRYAARSGAEVTKLGMGGNQASMNKRYSGQFLGGHTRPKWARGAMRKTGKIA